MKRKIAILSAIIMAITNITSVINYKTSNIEEINKKSKSQNIKFKSENYLDPNINDVINIINADFKYCSIEFWFASMALKKKLKIGYTAWTNYFGPMIEKINAYIFKHPVSTTTAGQLKMGLVYMFSQVIKYNFWKGGNDTDRDEPFWDGYQLAASYIIKNSSYISTFFKNKGVDAVFETEYWTNNYFLDKEQLEALGVETSEEVSIQYIDKFSMPSWFPILKTEIWDIDQYLFYYEKTSISVDKLDNKTIVEFKFADETIENLKKSLDKYSALDKISYYSGLIALSFCTILKQKMLNEFQIDETIAMQFATYIYKYRNEVNTWKAIKTAYIEENFYWFEDDMQIAYENAGSSFDSFKVLREWPI